MCPRRQSSPRLRASSRPDPSRWPRESSAFGDPRWGGDWRDSKSDSACDCSGGAAQRRRSQTCTWSGRSFGLRCARSSTRPSSGRVEPRSRDGSLDARAGRAAPESVLRGHAHRHRTDPTVDEATRIEPWRAEHRSHIVAEPVTLEGNPQKTLVDPPVDVLVVTERERVRACRGDVHRARRDAIGDARAASSDSPAILQPIRRLIQAEVHDPVVVAQPHDGRDERGLGRRSRQRLSHRERRGEKNNQARPEKQSSSHDVAQCSSTSVRCSSR